MDLSVLNYKDYKKYLRDYVSHLKPRRGIVSRMAEAAQCQPSYLSQVLTSHVQLTPDQALGISELINFSVVESEYFLLLVDHARAGSLKLKRRIEGKLGSLKNQNEDLSQRLNRRPLEVAQNQTVYYSNWLWSALHILVSIPRFQTTTSIAKKLSLEPELVSTHLEQLEKMGFVKRELGLWKHSGTEIHLPKESPLISLHHNNWRQVAVLKSQQQKKSNVNFTGIYAVSEEDFAKLKEIVLKNISTINTVATSSPEEKLICANIDFFEI